MNTQQNKLPFAISISIGTLVWYFFSFYTNHTDPQSTKIYWQIGYPILILSSFIISYYFGISVWRWPLLLVFSQAVIGIIISKGGGNLLPIGIIVHIVISIPCIIAAYCGLFLKRKLGVDHTEKK
jgi:hypothetical protein